MDNICYDNLNSLQIFYDLFYILQKVISIYYYCIGNKSIYTFI